MPQGTVPSTCWSDHLWDMKGLDPNGDTEGGHGGPGLGLQEAVVLLPEAGMMAA